MAPALSHAGASPVVARSPLRSLQYLDVVLVVLATPAALAFGAPAFGLLIAVGAWLLQRVLAHTDRRWIARAREPRTQLGLNLFEAFGRIWLLAGAIVVAGVVGGRADGLTAALTICGAYSVAFAIRVLSGPPQKKASGELRRRAVSEPRQEAAR
ncbi:MAG TPA: hypothetical protein VG147_16770 [Solirubrobacteraceae bacterium]|jgi:hypothetical protein|nr:hypothetical protein [Solirubrobacteraceae bacterium]